MALLSCGSEICFWPASSLGACGKERLEAMEEGEEGSMAGPPQWGVDGVGRKVQAQRMAQWKTYLETVKVPT